MPVSITQGSECRENGLDTPPNAVSTQHLSIDGQQTRTWTRTDTKNGENHPDDQINQKVGQDHPRGCGKPTPRRSAPLPLLYSFLFSD